MKKFALLLLALLFAVCVSCQLDSDSPKMAGNGVVDLSGDNGDGVIAIDLNQYSLNASAVSALNGKTSEQLASALGITDLPNWMEISLAKNVSRGDTKIVIIIKVRDGVSASSLEDSSISISINKNWIVDSNNQSPSDNITQDVVCSVSGSESLPAPEPDIVCLQDMTLDLEAGEEFEYDFEFYLVNLEVNATGANKIVNISNELDLPSGVSASGTAESGDSSFVVTISGAASSSSDISLVFNKSWFSKTSQRVQDFSSFAFGVSLNVTPKQSDPPSDDPAPSDDPTPSDDPDPSDDPTGDNLDDDPLGDEATAPSCMYAPQSGNNSISLTYQNSAEITKNGTQISAQAGQNLYTITIYAPDANEDYESGASAVSYGLVGSGSFKNAANQSLVSKTVPQGKRQWDDMIGYTGTKTTGNYWFTDTVNRIKYYISQDSINGIDNMSVNQAYWDEMKGYLLSGTLSQNYLRAERESFGLSEYNRDNTPYFYVIFGDFGSDRTTLINQGGRKSISGTVGVYNQTHIRPDEGRSNDADIFFVNSRYIIGYSEFCGRSRSDAANTAVSTLLHEYMHYLMDANILLKAEEEFSDDIMPETGTIYDESGYAPSGRYSDLIKDLTSGLYGSSFWIEGSANYASYRMIGDSDPNAVSEWLGIMSRWRPAISAYDGRSQADNVYAVYGAGGLFFSYVAETYGEQTENEFHSWRDTAASLSEMSAGGDAGSYCGNINVMAGSILKRDFKDVYSDFLCQCLLSLSDKSVIPGKTQREFKSAADWGFVKSNVDAAIDKQGFAISDAARGYESSDVEELAFVINRWDEIPERIEFEGDEFDCYAIWF